MGSLVLKDVLMHADDYAPELIVYVAVASEISGPSEVELTECVGPGTSVPGGKQYLLSTGDIRAC